MSSEIGQGSTPTSGGQNIYFTEGQVSNGDLEQAGEMGAAGEEIATDHTKRKEKAPGGAAKEVKQAKQSQETSAPLQSDNITEKNMDDFVNKIINDINKDLSMKGLGGRLPGEPRLSSPDGQTNPTKWTSASVMELIATVLGEVAEIAFKEKKSESRINALTSSLRKQNMQATHMIMQKMRINAMHQKAKAENAQRSMKATMITMIVVMAIASLALAPVLLPLIGPAATVFVVAMSLAAAAIMVSLEATNDPEKGNWLEQLIWGGEKPHGPMKYIVKILIAAALMGVQMIAMAPLFPVAMGMTAVQVAGRTVIEVSKQAMQTAMRQAALMIASQMVGSAAQAMSSTGALQESLTLAFIAMGMDEDEAKEIAMWVSLVILVLMALLSAGLGMAAGGQGAMTKAGSSTAERVVKNLETAGAVIEASASMAGGIATIYEGVMNMQIAKLKEEQAEMEYTQEMIKQMDKLLQQMAERALQEISDITEFAAGEMQKGNQIWNALNQSSNAIHLQSGA